MKLFERAARAFSAVGMQSESVWILFVRSLSAYRARYY